MVVQGVDRMLKPYQIEANDGQAVINVTACNTEWANISVDLIGPRRHQPKGSAQHQVSLPGFEFMVGATYGNQLGGTSSYYDMPDEVYRAYLEVNRPAILALVDRLNAPDYCLGTTNRNRNSKRRKVR